MENSSLMNDVNGSEANKLYKGIFWITDSFDMASNRLYFKIPVTADGRIIESNKLNLNSRNKDNYNHRLVWNDLPAKITHNKEYNFYPRGRVEIRRGKAMIFANPVICTEELKDWCIDKFKLLTTNGIKRIIMIPDGSEHYKCFRDLYT